MASSLRDRQWDGPLVYRVLATLFDRQWDERLDARSPRRLYRAWTACLSSQRWNEPLGDPPEGPHQALERPQRKAPALFDIAGHRRSPTRFRRLYERLERSSSSLNDVFYAGRTTEEERAMSFRCDAYVPSPSGCYYRGIEVLAPREIVYRWLCQLRVAPYSYDWFDNFGLQSPRRLTPGLERLRPGLQMLFMFKVVEFVENEHITLQSTLLEWFFGKVAMTYLLVPCSASSCRVVTKLTGEDTGTYANQLRGNYYPIGELPLMHKQLRTFKHLAERQFLEELANGRR